MISGAVQCSAYELGILVGIATIDMTVRYILDLADLVGLVAIWFLVVIMATIKLDIDLILANPRNTTASVYSMRFFTNLVVMLTFSAHLAQSCRFEHSVNTSTTTANCSWGSNPVAILFGNLMISILSLSVFRVIITGAQGLFAIFTNVWETFA